LFTLIFSCTLPSRQQIGQIDELAASKFLLYAYDHEKKISCVEGPELYLRVLHVRLEENKDRYIKLLKARPKADIDCIKYCTCEMWQDLAKEIELERLETEYMQLAQQQDEKACFDSIAPNFCASTLKQELDQQKSDFQLP
jgi:hypothetical protein